MARDEVRNRLVHGDTVPRDACAAMEECRKAHGGPIDREAIIGACVQAGGSEEDAETYLAAIAEERYRMAAESSIPSATTMARVRRAWENCFEVEGSNGDSAVVRLKSDVPVLGTGEIIEPGLYALPTLPASGGDRIWTNGALNWPGTADIAVGGENPGEGPHFSVPVFEYEDWWGNYHFLTGYGVAFLAAMQELMEVGDAGAARDMWIEVYGYRANGRVAEALELMGLPPMAENSPQLDTKPVTSHQIALSKVAATASNPAVYGNGGVGVNVSGKNEGEVLAMLALTYEGDGSALNVTTSRQITEFDKQVANAVASMFVAGNRVVSPAQVAEVVYGKKPCKSQIDAVDASLDKQMHTFVTIEGTGELRGRATADGSLTLKLQGYMLPTRVLEYADMANGIHGKAYELLDAPIFYRHDKEVQQITAVPQRLIEAISKDVRMNERAVIIRGYLTERAARAKNAGKKATVAHKHITYQKIYDRAGIGEDRKERQRVRETVHKMLDAMVAEGFIKSWQEYQDAKTKGKAKTGVEIKV